MQITSAYIGHAGVNSAFDGTQVPLTFDGGSASVTITAGGASKLSDVIAYNYDSTKDLIVALLYASNDVRFNSAGATGFASYVKAGAAGSDVSGTAPAGFSGTSNRAISIDLVEVRTAAGSPNNLTVRSSASWPNAPSVAPTGMKAVIRVKEAVAATAGTDYTLEFSRDDGANWTAATLTEIYTAPGSIRVCGTNLVDVSGQPSGTSLRWRFKTLNNKNVELHDALLYWQ